MKIQPPTIESDFSDGFTVLRWIALNTKDAVCAIVLVHVQHVEDDEYASWLVTEGYEGRLFLLDGDYNPDYEKALEIFNERLERELRRAR